MMKNILTTELINEAKEAFHEQYLINMDIYDKSEIVGIDHENIIVLDVTSTCYIVKVDADRGGQWLCIAWKRLPESHLPRPMQIVEL